MIRNPYILIFDFPFNIFLFAVNEKMIKDYTLGKNSFKRMLFEKRNGYINAIFVIEA